MTDWTIRFRFGGIESSLKYLEEMAAKGWMLEYWQENTLLFHRTEPKKLRFAMDIVPIGRWKLDGGRDNMKVREEFVAVAFCAYLGDRNICIWQPCLYKNFFVGKV